MICSNPMVKSMQLQGAGMAYTTSAIVLCVVLGIMIVVLYLKEKRNNN